MLNFNMNKHETTLLELANVLTSAEPNLKKDKCHIMVIKKSSARMKEQKKKAQKVKETKLQKNNKKDKKPKESCHFCHNEGHWKHNCRAYLLSLKENKHADAFT